MTGVAIIGAVQTTYEASKRHVAYNELVYEIVAELLQQTGVKMSDIHSQVTASQDLFDGKTISSMAVNEVVGGYLNSEAKVAADGIQALLYGAARVMSGCFEYTLVTAHCKESEIRRKAVTVTMFDPFCQRPLGVSDMVASALEARRVLERNGLTEEHLAEVSRRRHKAALKNPFAQRKGDFSLSYIQGSALIASPLREMTVGPTSDGACALLLANAHRAKTFGPRAVWIRGIGNATDAFWTERLLGSSTALVRAAERAYRMAGITSPAEEIHVAEISARCAHEEPLYAEALGLAPAGKIRQWLEEPETHHGCMINPSGGPITGNPSTVAGLTRVVEAYLQLTMSAAERQVPAAGVALAHGADGVCGQAQSIVVLSLDDKERGLA